MKVKWSKSIDGEAKKRIKELGEKLESLLHEAGITDAETLRIKQTLAARIIARVFRAEVRQLEQFAHELEAENMPELSEVLDNDKKKEISTED